MKPNFSLEDAERLAEIAVRLPLFGNRRELCAFLRRAAEAKGTDNEQVQAVGRLLLADADPLSPPYTPEVLETLGALQNIFPTGVGLRAEQRLRQANCTAKAIA